MKTILYTVCIGSLALALTAGGAQAAKDKRPERAKPQQRTAKVQLARPASTGRTMAAHRNVSTAQSRQLSNAKPRTSSAVNRVARPASATPATARERNVARNERTRERNLQASRAPRDVAVKTTAARTAPTAPATARERNLTVNRNRSVVAYQTKNSEANHERNAAVNRTKNADVNRARNANELRVRNNVAINRTANAAYYRGGNVRVTNNWRGDAFRGQRYAAFRNYNRQWHDRSWWRSHYNRIVFVNNGWYYWNAGYWFPAWGYAPSVSYVYDGPIYAYNGLSPDQVTVNVQQQLARAGYYDGPIDGALGPMTREAIATYQADNGPSVTSAIDEPTLATLGLV
jgi:hypothetical protein